MRRGDHLRGQCRGHRHLHAVRSAYLFAFYRYRNCAAKNNQVVEYPHHTDDHGEHLGWRAIEVAPDAYRNAHQVEQNKEDVGPRDHPVDVLFFHQSTFGGDVKFAFVRVNQRHQRRWCDIPRQHRFVDFTPEEWRYLPWILELVRLAWIICGSTNRAIINAGA